jgi:EAL domain-containing protein (putative c-di-GMP-specific phosphodiesterase class I)
MERIAVNVASRQMFDADFPAAVEQCLREHDLEGDQLELELTEASFVADFARANSVLGDLRRAGVSIAIDDFGTGYSSLGYLKELSFDALKIDRTFVNELPDLTSIAIIHAVMAVARSLDKKVVAEGIETEQQLRELARVGCQVGQGFLFGQPCAASELPARAAALAAGGYHAHDDMTGRERVGAVVVNAKGG